MISPSVAFAAFDFGTTAAKAAVVLPDGSFRVLRSISTKVRLKAAGGATCRASEVLATCRSLLEDVARVVAQQNVATLHLGLCAHVSSLLLWSPKRKDLENDDFPIWLDTSSHGSVEPLREFLSGGKDLEILGTSFPVVPNWLSVMIHHRLRRDAHQRKILQIHDYIYHLLTGGFETHYSGQVSLINNKSLDYADELLSFLGIDRENLPTIENVKARPLSDPYGLFADLGLPAETYIYPGLADRTAGFLGMGLEDGDGFLLASTSENSGIYELAERDAPQGLVRSRHADGWIYYGSTSSGGGTVSWFMDTIGGGMKGGALEDLYERAERVPAGSEALLFHPYLSGERAPHWNEAMAGSFIGLRAYHGREHLFRAVLEGIAFGKRELFCALGEVCPAKIKISGGGARHLLQNQIRASILKTVLEVYEDAEFALRGLVTLMSSTAGESGEVAALPPLDSQRVFPVEAWSRNYDDFYEIYREARERQRPLWDMLASHGGGGR